MVTSITNIADRIEKCRHTQHGIKIYQILLFQSAAKNIGNIANIRSFLPQKPAKVAKPTAEEIRARKEEELNLKKLKADEAMRKKDEAARAKQEERRLQNEARQKRVLEARQAKEQQRIHDRERTEKEAKVLN